MVQGIGDGSVRFTNGKDATAICIPQYERGFARLMAAATALDYAGLGWGEEAAADFAAAIEYAHAHGGLRKVKTLDLQRNKIGNAGMSALTRVIEGGALPKLTAKTCQVGFNPASKHVHDRMREVLVRRAADAKNEK